MIHLSSNTSCKLERVWAPCPVPATLILGVGLADGLAAQLWGNGAQDRGSTVQPEGTQPLTYTAAASQSTD